MMKENRKVLLISPSKILAAGFEGIFKDHGGFALEGVLTDLSRSSEVRLKNMNADVILVDPVLFDYSSRISGPAYLSEISDASIVVIQTSYLEEEVLKQYGAAVGLYEDPAMILNKLKTLAGTGKRTELADRNGLSVREKEILVCVAKGMINKEIADKYCISVHTVMTHRKNITKKTGIKTVAGLTLYALLNNLIDYRIDEP